MLFVEKCEFPRIPSFRFLVYAQNQNSEISESVILLQILTVRCKNDKKLTETTTTGQYMLLEVKKKNSKVSEFSILPYTQIRKLGNLGKCCFTSNFVSSCNFFPNLYFLERKWNLIFLWLSILSHIFPKNFIEVPQVFQKI